MASAASNGNSLLDIYSKQVEHAPGVVASTCPALAGVMTAASAFIRQCITHWAFGKNELSDAEDFGGPMAKAGAFIVLLEYLRQDMVTQRSKTGASALYDGIAKKWLALQSHVPASETKLFELIGIGLLVLEHKFTEAAQKLYHCMTKANTQWTKNECAAFKEFGVTVTITAFTATSAVSK